MARRLGPYAPLSATYSTDDAIIEAGEAAELLYVRGLAFCASSESDGFITLAQLKRFVGAGMDDVMARAARLVEVGLWEDEGSGFAVRAWLKWNASAEELGRARRKDRERKAVKKPEPDFHPEGEPEGAPEEEPESDDESERIPDGFQTEQGVESDDGSLWSPDGFQPRAPARVEARAPDSLNSTSLNTTPPTPPRGKRAKRRAGAEDYDADEDFLRFWDAYPEKRGKVDAFKAWQAAVSRGDNPELIIRAAAWYRDDPKRNPEHTKWAQGWLNGRRYKEQQPAQPRGTGNFWEN